MVLLTIRIIFFTILNMINLSYSAIGLTSCSVEASKRPKGIDNFNINSYMGRWYEQYRDNSSPFQSGDCVTATYSLLQNNTVRVENRQYFRELKTDDTDIGSAVCANLTKAACTVSFPNPSTPNIPNLGPNYLVFSTNYTDYAIVYSCQGFQNFWSEFVWVLTREANPSQQKLDNLFDKITKELGYPENRVERSYHGNDCVYERITFNTGDNDIEPETYSMKLVLSYALLLVIMII